MVEYEQAVSDLLCQIRNLLNRSDLRETRIITFTIPEDPTTDSGTREFVAGETTINFKNGLITNPNGVISHLTYSLDTYQRDMGKEVNLRSLTIDTDQDIVLTVKGQPQWKWHCGAGYRELPSYIEFTEIAINTATIANIKIFACTNPQATIFNFSKASDITSLIIKDANFTVTDDSDTSKGVKFQLSGVSTGTIRTLTVPDNNATIMNRANILRGILPVASGWDTDPTNLANVTDGDMSTVTGTGINVIGTASYIGYLTFDLTTTKTVLFGYRIGVWNESGNENIGCIIESSDDNITYRSCSNWSYYTAANLADTSENIGDSMGAIVTGRYIRMAFYAMGATTAFVKIYEAYGYEWEL